MGLINIRSNVLRLICAFAIFVTGQGSASLAASVAAAPTLDIDLAFQRARQIVEIFDEQRLTIAGQTRILGVAPASIISFVQSEIRLDIYRGSLRGGRGALLARSGNPLDQALLLDQMLGDAGITTRLRKIALTPDQQRRLLEIYKKGTLPNLDYLVAPNELARAAGVKPEVISRAKADRQKDQREILATAERWATSLAPLKETLDQSTRDWQALPSWFYLVEYRDQGRWKAANPIAEFDAKTRGELAGFDGQSLPAQLQHRFSLRVMLQVQNPSGERSEQALIEFSAQTSALYLTPISLQITPDGVGISRSAINLTRALDSQNMVLTLRTGPNNPMQTRYFNRNGDVSRTRAPEVTGVADANAGGLAGIGGALGGIFGTTATPEPTKPELTDIIVEYGYTTSKGTLITRRRSLARLQRVDKIETAVFWGADIFVDVGPISRQVVGLSRLKAMLATEPLLQAVLANAAAGLRNAPDAEMLQTLGKTLGASNATAAVEFSLMAHDIAQQKSPRLYQSAPTIIAVEGAVLQRDGKIVGKTLIDIAALQTARIDCTVTSCTPPSPLTRFKDGIIWTAAERAFVADLTDPTRLLPTAKRRAMVENAGSALEQALSRGDIRLNTIDNPAALKNASEVNEANVRAAMLQDIENGYFAVTTTNSTSAANWWRLDPVTGLLLGTGPEGRGQGVTQKAELDSNAVILGKAFVNYGSMLGCMYGLGNLQNNAKTGKAYFAGKVVFCVTSGTLGIAGITGQLGASWNAVGAGAALLALGADAYETHSSGGATGADLGAIGSDLLGAIIAFF